jgi:uncharacterized protein (TIGR00255 family)
MIKSMTGFAKCEAAENGVHAIVELKSLNGRFLDIHCRMPRSISHRERDVRDAVRKVLDRGNVQVNITTEFDETAKPSSINPKAAERCWEDLNRMRNELKLRETIKIEHLLHFSDTFMQEEEGDDESMEIKVVMIALKEALKSIDQMRTKEGGALAKDIKNRINIIEKQMDEAEKISLRRVPEERERLRERVAMLFDSDEIDEQRLQTEIVFLADKLDVSEEVARMRSHIDYFRETVKAPDSAGKKLNFMLQEMNREVNTLGTKIADAEASKIVVGMKEELEKIREQVQNIV